MPEIRWAPSAGFCFGVARALAIAQKAAEDGIVACTWGELIHNRHVVEKLEAQGIAPVSKLASCPEGVTVILRSHGVGPRIIEEIERAGHPVLDATCPFVARIHKLAQAKESEGKTVLILGDPAHPEVYGIAGWCHAPVVVADAAALKNWLSADAARREIPLVLVTQTTAPRREWEKCAEILKRLCTNAEIIDTMCDATVKRQQEAGRLAAECDAMIVVGDEKSSNTQKLAEVCRQFCETVYLVPQADALPLDELRDKTNVGLTAGASAPPWIIEEVYVTMTEELNTGIGNEESFEALLEQSLKTIHSGEKVRGVVTNITNTEVHVDLGTKHAGYIPVDELSDDPDYKVADHLKIGDEIDTYAIRVNDLEGTVMLSKKRLDAVRGWDDLEDAGANQAIMTGIVTEENKGGLVVSVHGVRVFVPASQTGLAKDVPMSTLLKTKVKLRITEVNRARRRVVGSIRAYQVEERRALSEAIWDNIEVGRHFNGVVKSIMSYGTFVDIGGVDGMVHISELTWSRIAHPSEVVKVGDKLDVYVLSFDREKKKISLGHKERGQDPWSKFTETYHVGDTAKVRVVKLMPFGAFAEVIPGVDGLIHISQLSDRRIVRPADAVMEGQTVTVKITEIDNERKKISLSIRALLEPEVPEAEQASRAGEPDEIVAIADESGTTTVAEGLGEEE